MKREKPIDVPVKRWTLLDVVRLRERESLKMLKLREDVERLAQANPLLQDAPYAEIPKAEDFVGLDAVLPKFVDPLEQLEAGRELNPWQREMCRRFGRNDPWVKKYVLGDWRG